MKKYVFLIVFFVCLIQVNAQDSLTIDFLKEEYTVDKNLNAIDISITIYNNGVGSLMLYDLESIKPGGDFESYSKKNNSVGLVIHFTDSLGNGVMHEISGSRHHDSLEEIENSINNELERFRESRVIIKPKGEFELTLQFDLTKVSLDKNTYFMELIYYSQNNIYNLVDKQEVMNAEKEYNAKLFQGCIKSNKIPITVY